MVTSRLSPCWPFPLPVRWRRSASRLPLHSPCQKKCSQSPGIACPPQPRFGDFDWIQFKNGEWLKGKIKDLLDESLSFESDELDVLQIDWDDIYAVYSPRANTCVFEDRTSVLGTLRIDGKTVTIVTSQGEEHYDREDLRSIIPGGLRERDYWSGKWSIGLNVRSGNTNQSDLTSYLSIQRRIPSVRTRLEYTGSYGSYENEETVNNQQTFLTHDIFLNRRLYARAPSFQYYRDKFQNIDYRLTPGAGLGYGIIDRGDTEWNVGGGLVTNTLGLYRLKMEKTRPQMAGRFW